MPAWEMSASARQDRVNQRGVVISTPDAHVAQCAIDLGGELLTMDKVFEQTARATALRLAAAT